MITPNRSLESRNEPTTDLRSQGMVNPEKSTVPSVEGVSLTGFSLSVLGGTESPGSKPSRYSSENGIS